MRKQKDLINKRKWDVLVVLDACRYDYFENSYADYLDGELSKVESSGSITPKWFKRTFTKRFDETCYISSNPFINSQVSIKGVNASEYFPNIVDVWDSGWNDNIGTVKPEEINNAFFEQRDEKSSEKYILHYMQPHQPYISIGGEEDWSGIINRDSDRIDGRMDGLKLYIGDLIKSWLGKKTYWSLREKLGVLENPMGRIVLEQGDEKLREVYEKDLNIVLEKVSEMVRETEERIVVTADHGELLGKGEGYGHHPNNKSPQLKEVPWLEVER